MPEHKLTLADLEAVEKARELIAPSTPTYWSAVSKIGAFEKCDQEFIALAANHAVAMKQALTEALEVIEKIKQSVGFYAEEEFPLPSHQGSCGTPMASCDAGCMEIAAMAQHNRALLGIARFEHHWPGLMKGKKEGYAK